MNGTALVAMSGSALLVSASAALMYAGQRASAQRQAQSQAAAQQAATEQQRRASSRQLPNAGPSDVNPVPDSVPMGKSAGAPLKDPRQGGKCGLAKNRAKACGATGCSLLPSCPAFKKGVAEARYAVGFIEKPTGITNKSAAVSNGLDPQGILNIVNKLRAQLGCQPLQWDDRLACAATAWAPMTHFDLCPHGAAPGFPYYPQVVGASASLTKTPMQVAEEAIVELMWNQEKPLADSKKISPVTAKVQAGWKKCGAVNPIDMKLGHYCVLGDDALRCCGFGFGLNHTKSGYISTPQTVTPIICGHFS